MSNQLIAILFIAYALLFAPSINACEPVAPAHMGIAVDLDSGLELFYNNKTQHSQRPSISLDGCQSTARDRKFLMVGVAQENPILTNETQGFVLNEIFEVYQCSIKNAPEFQTTQSSMDRYLRLLERRTFLNNCLQIQVTDFSPAGIRYPEVQPSCQIERVSESSVNFTGAYCFFEPHQTSTYSIHAQIKQECRDPKQISKLFEAEVTLEDFSLLLNTYIAGDASGKSPDLTAKSVTNLRISYNPINNMIPVSENFGEERPRWPSNWHASNVHFGPLTIENSDRNYDKIKLPFLVDSRCERVCQGDFCSSACDYSQPLAAELALYEVVKGKDEFIRQWYDGGVVPAQFQGFIHGLGMEIPKNVFEEGKTYKIKAQFMNPSYEFAFFAGRVARIIGLRTNHIGELSRNSRINQIPRISVIEDHELIPQVPRIRSLNFEYRPFGDFTQVLTRFRSHLHNAFWPPSLEKMCSANNERCAPVDTTAIELELEFKIDRAFGNEFILKDMKETRRSKLDQMTYVKRSRQSQPALECTIDGASNNNDNDFDYTNF